jgi:hypothetical protein
MRRLSPFIVAAGLLVARSADAQFTPPPLPPGSGIPVPPPSSEPPWQAPPDTRLILIHLLVARYNPLGLEYQLRAGVQKKLYASPSPTTRDNFVFAGLSPKINPAYVKVGPSFEIQPASFFNLRVAGELVGYFSTFGYLQSYASPMADYSDTAIAAGKEAKRNYSTYGGHVMIEPSVQLRVGDVVVRDKMAVEYWRMNVHDGDRVFYDVTLDTVLSKDGWVVSNDADLLFLHDFKDWTGTLRGARLTIGARYTMVKPLYQRGDFAPGDQPAREDNGHHRVGPLLAFTFFDHGFEALNRPTVLVIVNWYADHRYRAGQDVNQAIPYFVLGLAAQTDFLK